MPDDQAQSILAPVQVDNSVKADAWQAFKDSANEREYGVRLQGMNLPQDVKAQLWEAKRSAGAATQLQPPNALAQARQTIQSIPQFTSPTDELRANLANAQSGVGPAGQKYNEYMRQSGMLAGTAAGGMAAQAIPALQAMKGVAGLATRAAATGAATGAGALAGGATPKEAAVTGAGGAIGQPIAEGITAAASPLLKWMTASKTAGAAALQQASAKAGSAPVAISPKTDQIVDEIVTQGKLGGTIPKVVSDFLERVGPSVRQSAEAAPNPLTYNEARILQSNASTLSAQEQMALKGRLKYLMPQFAKSLAEDVQNAANQAGVGAEHALGMQQYAAASARNRVLAKGAKVAAEGAGTYGGYKLLQNLMKK